MILDWALTQYNHVVQMLSPYPMAQNALVTIVSAGAIGGITFALIRLPRAVAEWFRNQCMTKLVFNTASSAWSDYNAMQYMAFIRWFSKNRWFGWSRVITFDSSDGNSTSTGPGLGKHFFFYDWRLFVFSISEMDSQGTQIQKYKISISVIGRSKKPLYKLMSDFMVKPDRQNKVGVYSANSDGCWRWITYMPKRNLDTVIMSPEIAETLTDTMDKFVNEEQWYRQRGLNYKMTYLLYGPPGTGKSSLIRALASHYNRDVHILDLNKVHSGILELLQKAKGGVVVIEDIDSFGIAKSRSKKPTDVNSDAKPKPSIARYKGDVPDNGDQADTTTIDELLAEFGGSSLSGLLNALDGVIGLDDVVVFMTTNHPEKLDPALIRDGRVDVRLEIGYLEHPEICRYIAMFFPDYVLDPTIAFMPLPGATVQKHFMLCKDNPDRFVELLREASIVATVDETDDDGESDVVHLVQKVR